MCQWLCILLSSVCLPLCDDVCVSCPLCLSSSLTLWWCLCLLLSSVSVFLSVMMFVYLFLCVCLPISLCDAVCVSCYPLCLLPLCDDVCVSSCPLCLSSCLYAIMIVYLLLLCVFLPLCDDDCVSSCPLCDDCVPSFLCVCLPFSLW